MPSISQIATNLRVVLLAISLLSVSLAEGQTSLLYGISAGTAKAQIQGTVLLLSNQTMQIQWSVAERRLTTLMLTDRTTSELPI
jgi:hypothetical protein